MATSARSEMRSIWSQVWKRYAGYATDSVSEWGREIFFLSDSKWNEGAVNADGESTSIDKASMEIEDVWTRYVLPGQARARKTKNP